MNLKKKKKVFPFELTIIKEMTPSYKNIERLSGVSSKPTALSSSSRFTTTQLNKTESSKKLIEEQELDKLIKIRNDLKTKLLKCKDEVSEKMLTKCFQNIHIKIKK